MRHARAFFFGVVVVVLAAPASASDGAVPIWEPTIITEAGKYVVTRNLAGSGPVLDIRSSDVEIDLNGFVLTGSTTHPTILGVTVSNVRIHDGTVKGGDPAIYFEVTSKVVIENVGVSNTQGIGVQFLDSGEFVVRDCSITSAEQAIHATPGTGGLIELNRITGSGSVTPVTETILLQGGLGSTVRSNKLTYAIHQVGIRLLDCRYCVVSDNVVDDFGADELLSGVTVESSAHAVVRGNATSEKIHLIGSFAAKVSDNHASSFVIDDASHSNVLVGNAVEVGGSYGMLVDGDRNRIEDNLLNNKPGFGLYFTPAANDNVYGGNVAKGNLGSGCTGTGTTDFCDEGAGNVSRGDNFMPGPM